MCTPKDFVPELSAFEEIGRLGRLFVYGKVVVDGAEYKIVKLDNNGATLPWFNGTMAEYNFWGDAMDLFEVKNHLYAV